MFSSTFYDMDKVSRVRQQSHYIQFAIHIAVHIAIHIRPDQLNFLMLGFFDMQGL